MPVHIHEVCDAAPMRRKVHVLNAEYRYIVLSKNKRGADIEIQKYNIKRCRSEFLWDDLHIKSTNQQCWIVRAQIQKNTIICSISEDKLYKDKKLAKFLKYKIHQKETWSYNYRILQYKNQYIVADLHSWSSRRFVGSCNPNCKIVKLDTQFVITTIRTVRIGECLSLEQGAFTSDKLLVESRPCRCPYEYCCGRRFTYINFILSIPNLVHRFNRITQHQAVSKGDISIKFNDDYTWFNAYVTMLWKNNVKWSVNVYKQVLAFGDNDFLKDLSNRYEWCRMTITMMYHIVVHQESVKKILKNGFSSIKVIPKWLILRLLLWDHFLIKQNNWQGVIELLHILAGNKRKHV